MARKKKIAPTKIIEDSGDPLVEHAFIKYPRESPVDVSKDNDAHNTSFSGRKIDAISTNRTEMEKRNSTEIHTHPFYPDESGKYGEPIVASGNDIGNLFSSNRKKHMIAYRDKSTGEVAGYLVLRRLKRTNDLDEIQRRATGVHHYLENSEKVGVHGTPFYFKVKGNYKAGIQKGYDAALNKASKEIGFAYKYVPAKGYEFDMEKGGLVKKTEFSRTSKPSKVEQAVLTISILCISISIIFLSLNMTGNVISNLNQTYSNWISGVLFIIGIIGALFYFKIRLRR